ncbi:MAG TPA: aminotransferase class III-fold pyridoxal phosphate-dependent enzyme, partial [Pseudomonadales bacterium]
MTTPDSQPASRPVFYRTPGEDYPLAVSASGVTITDSTGKQYLDMSGGAAVSCLGHGHPDVVAAISRQLGTLDFAHTRFFSSEPQEALARRIADQFGAPGARVYFTSGGSEANETALKLAWQYWAALGQPGKKLIISREHSYHGNTFGALSVSGNDGRRRASAAPLLDWPRIPPCYEYRERAAGESSEAYAERAAGYLDAALRSVGSDTVAAFICEPVVGSSLGVVPGAPGYLARIREICDRHGILLIADEVMCGSGRTGTFFAHTQDDVRPDIVTLAKGLAGGYQPLAATVLGAELGEVLGRAGFAHGHTYVGHPVAC